MVEAIRTDCALALSGIDDEEVRISLDTWLSYTYAESKIHNLRARTRDEAFGIMCDRTCGERRVDVFVIAAALHVWE